MPGYRWVAVWIGHGIPGVRGRKVRPAVCATLLVTAIVWLRSEVRAETLGSRILRICPLAVHVSLGISIPLPLRISNLGVQLLEICVLGNILAVNHCHRELYKVPYPCVSSSAPPSGFVHS